MYLFGTVWYRYSTSVFFRHPLECFFLIKNKSLEGDVLAGQLMAKWLEYRDFFGQVTAQRCDRVTVIGNP